MQGLTVMGIKYRRHCRGMENTSLFPAGGMSDTKKQEGLSAEILLENRNRSRFMNRSFIRFCWLKQIVCAVIVSAGTCSAAYRALTGFSSPEASGTWKILNRDGASRKVAPYLSSLGRGETGTGSAVSPVFTIAFDTITFTCCGHDGQQGDKKLNYAALVDAESGGILQKTYAPLSDSMQARSWDVQDLKGRNVRFKAHDGDAGSAFAWLGIGRIDAGESLRVDFQKGLPEGWKVTAPETPEKQTELLEKGIPFLRCTSRYSLIPKQGEAHVLCGFKAERFFFLGATVARADPLDVCGRIVIEYADGDADSIPLMAGFTLEREGKLLSPSPCLKLHTSEDPFHYYFVFSPEEKAVERITFKAAGGAGRWARITAVTCETEAYKTHLKPLPEASLSAEERRWITDNEITSDMLKGEYITALKRAVRKAHKMDTGAKRLE